jgi:hypothetical protein
MQVFRDLSPGAVPSGGRRRTEAWEPGWPRAKDDPCRAQPGRLRTQVSRCRRWPCRGLGGPTRSGSVAASARRAAPGRPLLPVAGRPGLKSRSNRGREELAGGRDEPLRCQVFSGSARCDPGGPAAAGGAARRVRRTCSLWPGRCRPAPRPARAGLHRPFPPTGAAKAKSRCESKTHNGFAYLWRSGRDSNPRPPA